jgi:hypothetical protein
MVPGFSLRFEPWAEISERLRRNFKLRHDSKMVPGFSLRFEPWAEISERLRRNFKLRHYSKTFDVKIAHAKPFF